jgi:prepilin-type N-terminal cleavage/methylation domain-containing protein
MSCALRTDRRRGLSLVELMIVSVIVLVFTGSAVTVFIQLIQTSDEVDARIEAVTNARFFLDTLSDDLGEASTSLSIPRGQIFQATHTALTYGDLVDNDRDGAIDEEAPDGQDNDNDWVLARDDRDFQTNVPTSGAGGLPPIVPVAERGYQEPDLGDDRVDEDIVFNQDELSFWVRGPLSSNILRQQLTYRIEVFDGEDNVAVRRTRTVYTDGTPDLEEVGPLAFEVLSLNFLCWEHKGTPQRWVESWDSGATTAPDPPAPVSVYAEITVHGDSTRLRLPPTRPLGAVRMGTIIALENVLRSPDFPRGQGRIEGEPLTMAAMAVAALTGPAQTTGPQALVTAPPAPR